MTILVSYEGQPVATVGARRVHLSPTSRRFLDGDPLLRFVTIMCAYALDVAQAAVVGPYSDDDARAFARAALISDEDLARVATRDDADAAAERLAVPRAEVTALPAAAHSR